MSHVIPTALVTRIARLALLLGFCAGLTTAQTRSENYTFLLGSGFLCDASDATACPAAAKAIQSDRYDLSGAGTFDVHSRSVKAAGTFTHRSVNGQVLESGVWTGSELVSFTSYGVAPGELLHERQAFAHGQLDPRRAFIHSATIPTGGLAVLRISLLSVSGIAKSARLEMNCTLGDVPRERAVEGIRLLFDGSAAEFLEQAGGRVMFLSLRPVTVPANATQTSPAPDSPGTPSK